MPGRLAAMVQAGFAATLRALRVLGPVWKYRSPSWNAAPNMAACGRPSGLTVPRTNVVSMPNGPAVSSSSGRLHGIGCDPEVVSRLVVSIGSRVGMPVQTATAARTHRPRREPTSGLTAPVSEASLRVVLLEQPGR